MSDIEGEEIGSRFVSALVAKDEDALAGLFAPQTLFRGLTPGDAWKGATPPEVVEVLLGEWFEPGDHIQEVLGYETEQISDRTRLRYRLRVETEGVTYLVDQQGYLDLSDGRITRMSLMCSGFRPWPG
jgi:hypothetical protein